MKIDIPNYEGLYQYDTEINQVFGITRNKYLKNNLLKGVYYVSLWKNNKVKTYGIRNLSIICIPIENNNLVDIPNYNNYKFDLELSRVYNTHTNKYLKNNLDITKGYYRVCLSKNGKCKFLSIHRLVYMCNNPTEDISQFQIDHIDGNRTNNKIENLRKATNSENQSNKKTMKTNKLGIKYIHKIKNGYYRFKLTKNKIRYEKEFKTLEEAREYRDITVREICGEFANLG